MKSFISRKTNLLPSFIIFGLFYGLIICLLFGIWKSSIFLLFIIGFGVAFVYIFLNLVFKSVAKLEVKVADDGLQIKRGDNQEQTVSWRDIKGMRFFTTGGGLAVLMGPFSKYLGFYRLETDQGKIDLPPSLDNLDSLLKSIIQHAHLKKHFPTIEGSMFGEDLQADGVFTSNYPYWKKEENYQPSKVDLKTNVAGLSKSAIQLFFILVLGVIFVFFLLKFLAASHLI